ncbi:hypothetical protein DPMN_152881 [Dreissena polymorpha]|uniref:Prominin-like protein n=1 Tax=Dreissena polymorpha TaxID=45954 RepID=A0A9D4FMQ3_DREPO|nr:hypothetical protein DPMN_152881 [Dreissena polymorpha]
MGLFLLVVRLAFVRSADPVYSPQTISDAHGNAAGNDSVITWGALPAGEAYSAAAAKRISEGLSVYYDMVHGFVNAIFIKGFPDEIVEKLLTQDLKYITDNYSTFITYFIGYAIAVAVGLLFLLIFPIVALCFCCCRCCGNCGGKMRQEPKDAENTCKKTTFVMIVLICSAFLATSAACIYVNNENMTKTLAEINGTINDNVKDMKTFANNTIAEAEHVIGINFNFTRDALFREMDNIDYLVGIPIREEIKSKTNISEVLNTTNTLVASMNSADTALSAVESAKTALDTSITDLNTALNNFESNMRTIETNCNCPTQFPPYAVSTNINGSQLPDLTSARTSMNSAKNANLTQSIAEANNIPQTVKNESNSTVADMKTSIGDLSEELDDIQSQMENFQLSGPNASIDIDSYLNPLDEYIELLTKYDKYRWYGGIGLASVVALVVVFCVLGIVFGCLGSDTKTPPYERGCMSRCGGCFLMTAAALIMIFSALLMLLTFPTFMLGAPIQEVLCEPLTDMDKLAKYEKMYSDSQVGEGNYTFGKMILNNATINLTLNGILRSCRNGASAFNAFQLGMLIDIDDKLNYSKTVNITGDIDTMVIDMSTVQVYSTDMKTQLADLKAAVGVNFTQFFEELANNPTSVDLDQMATSIDTAAGSIPDPHATNLRAQATELRRIKSQEYAYLQGNVTALNSSVANMEAAVSNMPTQIDKIDTGLNFTQEYISKNVSTFVKSQLRVFADRVVNVIDSFVDFTDDAVKNKLGKCEPVWNVYNSLIVYTVCYNFMDCFNGFWFSLGWAVFFFLFGLIFSVKTAKYFLRMDKCEEDLTEEDEEFDYANGHTGKEPVVQPWEHHTPAKGKFWQKRNKVQHYDSNCPDTQHSSNIVPRSLPPLLILPPIVQTIRKGDGSRHPTPDMLDSDINVILGQPKSPPPIFPFDDSNYDRYAGLPNSLKPLFVHLPSEPGNPLAPPTYAVKTDHTGHITSNSANQRTQSMVNLRTEPNNENFIRRSLIDVRNAPVTMDTVTPPPAYEGRNTPEEQSPYAEEKEDDKEGDEGTNVINEN